MNKKKLLSLGLAGVMAIGMLAGCGSSTSSEATSSEATSESADPSAEAETTVAETTGGETVTLAVWNEPNADDSLNMYKACEAATGIHVEVTVIPETDYSSKLNQMVSTGDSSTDIYVVWENDIKNFAEAGGIINLDDYLASSDIKTDDMIDAVAKLSEGLGGTYGLPWCAAAEIMYYNKDMFEAPGI